MASCGSRAVVGSVGSIVVGATSAGLKIAATAGCASAASAAAVAVPVTGGLLAATAVVVVGVVAWERFKKKHAKKYIKVLVQSGLSMWQIPQCHNVRNEVWGRALVSLRDVDKDFKAACSAVEDGLKDGGLMPTWACRIPDEKLAKLGKYKTGSKALSAKIARYVHKYCGGN